MVKHGTSQRSGAIFSAVLLAAAAGGAVAGTVSIPFNPANFSNAPTIDNPYWPLTKFAGPANYRAITRDGCTFNKVRFTGTRSLAAVGVEVAVFRDQVWDTPLDGKGGCDTANAQLSEDTLDLNGQDNDGNIWYFGESTWKPVDTSNECSNEGAWEAGQPVNDPNTAPAQPGVVMLANPKPGDRYQQEFFPGVAEDQAAVLRLNARVRIGIVNYTYTDCLVTKEWSPLEHGAIEHKFYCLKPPGGPGLVYIEEHRGKTVKTRFVGKDFPKGLPGDGDAFPSPALPCTVP